ncbi:unnamed protein product [Mytilus edulis]|uniref:B box-type domain-containing protein n=1 Tax=Mytilus edulis TaxID=6550 RepID=A0A8S3UJ69_MYTED|nr:unnamed protein product [Mytilus edulis]
MITYLFNLLQMEMKYYMKEKKETKQVTHECNRFSAKSCRSFIESQESLNNCQNEDSQDSQESLKRKRDKEFASTDLKQGEKDHKKTKISDDIVIHKQQRKHDGGLPCKRCRDEDRTNIATVYCTYCEIPLCTECSGIHKKNKKTEKAYNIQRSNQLHISVSL